MFVHVRMDHFSVHSAKDARKRATGCCCKQDKSHVAVVDVENTRRSLLACASKSSTNPRIAIVDAQKFTVGHSQPFMIMLQAH